MLIFILSDTTYSVGDRGSTKPFYSNLDGLRGVAILVVVLHHGPLGVPELSTLAHNGRLGVDLFFCISGFLICSLFFHEKKTTGAIALAEFYKRRVSRLFPLYYLVLGLYCALVYGSTILGDEARAIFTEKLPSYVFYYSNFLVIGAVGPFAFAWSLAVEEQFYTLFGVLMRFISRRVVLWLVLSALVAKVLYFWFIPASWALSFQAERIIFSYRESILLGVLLAFFLNSPRGKRIHLHPVVPSLLLLSWFLCLTFFLFEGHKSFALQAFFLLTTVLIGASVVSRPIPLVSGKVASQFGKVSYGVYLTHFLFLRAFSIVTASPIIVFIATIISCYFINTLIFEQFEKPAMRALRSLTWTRIFKRASHSG